LDKDLGPIPGQSLTAEPGASQYERPPKFAKPEEAFEVYLDKFSDEETREGLFALLEQGIAADLIANMLTREATRNGVHSIDVAVILRPMVHEYISVLAEAAGIEFTKNLEDPYKKSELSRKERRFIANKVNKQLENEPIAEEAVDEEMSSIPDQEPLVEEPTMQPSPAPAGLMRRPM
jgi:hypothetical protein